MPFVGSTLVPERRERSLLFFSRYELLVCLRLVAMRETKKTPLSLLKDGAEGGSPGGKNSVFDCLPKVLTVFFHPFWAFTCTDHPSLSLSLYLSLCVRACVSV